MLTLAQALVAWAPGAAQRLAGWLAAPSSQRSMVAPFLAGCDCLSAMATLASRLDVQPGAAFRIAAACQLVFGVGRIITPVLAAQVEITAAAGQQPHPAPLGLLATVCALQLEAVGRWARALLLHDAAHTAAAFARSTARPAALLPWLAAVMRGVLALRGRLHEQEMTAGGQAGKTACAGHHMGELFCCPRQLPCIDSLRSFLLDRLKLFCVHNVCVEREKKIWGAHCLRACQGGTAQHG